MKVCSYCHSDNISEALFCVSCGKEFLVEGPELDKDELRKLTKKERALKQKQLEEEQVKKKAPRNHFGTLGIILLLIALVVFDGILGMIFNAINLDYKIVFVISTFIYILGIVSSSYSILIDNKAKKTGLEPSGNITLSIAGIVISLYIILVNIQQVILK